MVFVALRLPAYLGIALTGTQMPVREDVPLRFPLLLVHILAGSVALLTSCLQVRPRFRRRYPAAHRWSGRLYVFAGVLPSGVTALPVAWLGSTGAGGAFGNSTLAILWVAFTVAGFRAARQRRYADHRKWMVLSFALAFSIVMSLVWLVVCALLMIPTLDTVYGGDAEAMIAAAGSPPSG